MLATLTIVGLVVAAVLIWFFMRTRSADLITEMIEKRRSTAKLVGRGDYMEGMERIPVGMALTDDTFYYENPDLQASFELARIDEVEYDNELATGKHVEAGHRALRLRSHGTTFEFIIPDSEAQKWMAALPPRRQGDTAARAV